MRLGRGGAAALDVTAAVNSLASEGWSIGPEDLATKHLHDPRFDD